MALDFSKFDLSEEQLTELNSMVTSEIDRARTQASQTAHNNAEKDFQAKLPDLLREAIESATTEANKTAEQRAAEEWQTKFDQLNTSLADARRDRNRWNNEAIIRKAGISDDGMANTFATMFADNPDGLPTFLEAFNNSVETQVQGVKQTLLNNATPPGASSSTGNSTASFATVDVNKMVQDNMSVNGGSLDDASLFAQVRAVQQI